MNILCRILAIFAIFALVGCASGGGSSGGGGGATVSASDDSGGLTDEKLKELGIAETYDKR